MSYTPSKRNFSSHTFSPLSKDPSAGKSTQFGSPSTSKKSLSRLEDALRMIDSGIHDVMQNRTSYEDGIREVRGVNSEILEYGRSRRGSDEVRQDLRDFKCYLGNEGSEVDVRAMLNEEMRKNNYLMGKVAFLEEQNSRLRATTSSHQTQNLRNENMELREKLSQSSRIPHQLYDDLQELKSQNEMLRKDTVRLLHKY